MHDINSKFIVDRALQRLLWGIVSLLTPCKISARQLNDGNTQVLMAADIVIF
jgi:hypothetical protein